MPLTRRKLLGAMARVGGAGAVYETLAAWEFLKPPPAQAAQLALPRDSGTGRTVAILGAGVAGLCTAYELDRAGYDCVVLEASRRLGGRSLTLRRGDVFAEAGGPPQECRFDEGLWLNAGPGRIPHHHVQVIDYCRQFGVALQPYIFASRANLVHSGDIGNGKTYQVRRALYDLQGHVAELLDKCSNKAGLDQAVTGNDLTSLQAMLEKFGGLSPDRSYRNEYGRAGYEIQPGLANQPGKPLSPLALDEILRSNVWNDFIFRDAEYFWQTSLLEPVDGMDNFVKAFGRQPLTRQAGTIEGLIRYGAKVVAIEVGSEKTDIRFEDGGAERTLATDYCVSTIPMPIFRNLRTNLPPAYMAAARALPVQAAGKVGWQADRFWETRDQIYGGISWTTDVITQVGTRRRAISAARACSPAPTCTDPRPRPSMPGRSPSACRSPRTRASGCMPTMRNSSSMGSRSAGTTWSSRASAGSTRATRLSALPRRFWPSRRGGFTWQATRSPGGAAGRKARSSAPSKR
jgi:monoamine oxidase